MPRPIDHQPINLAPGVYDFQANLDPGTIIVRLARQTTATPQFWAEGVEIDMQVELSDDNGQSWYSFVAFTSTGGIVIVRDGAEAAETWLQTTLPPTVTRTRLTLTITGGTLVSELTLERI
jgi:hypothetical protein